MLLTEVKVCFLAFWCASIRTVCLTDKLLFKQRGDGAVNIFSVSFSFGKCVGKKGLMFCAGLCPLIG